MKIKHRNLYYCGFMRVNVRQRLYFCRMKSKDNLCRGCGHKKKAKLVDKRKL